MSILMNSVTFIIFYGDLLYKSPVFKVFKNRRLTLNVIKVTEIIRIDIVECQSQPLFFDSPLIMVTFKYTKDFPDLIFNQVFGTVPGLGEVNRKLGSENSR